MGKGGGGSSDPEPVFTQEQVQDMVRNKGLEKENEHLKEKAREAEIYRDQQRDQQEEWMARNQEQMEKYMQILKDGGQRDRGLDAQVEKLESARADAERKVKDQEEKLQHCQRLMEMKEKDAEEAGREAFLLKEKYNQLEKDKEDWKKAEEEKSKKLMEDSPPPFSLRKNPPDMSPLYTHEMACIAVMGRSGTGKSTMINKLVETFTGRKTDKLTPTKLKQGAMGETTMGCPAPVFVKTSDGKDLALFDRPGVGLKSLQQADQQAIGEEGDATTKFIRSQGLRWWTAVILNIDRDATPQEALIYAMCKAIGTPIIVTRNKMGESLQKEKQDCDTCGDVYDETVALRTVEDYITNTLHVDQGSWLLIDTYHPDKFQWKELVDYIEQTSRRPSTAGVAEK